MDFGLAGGSLRAEVAQKLRGRVASEFQVRGSVGNQEQYGVLQAL